MKKRIAIIALSVFALGAIAAGCATKNGDKKPDGSDTVYTVTFVQPDKTEIKVKAKKNDKGKYILNSEDIPAIDYTGYEGYEGLVWNRKSFDNITADITVQIDYTGKKAIEYTVKYDVNGGVGTINDYKVTYDKDNYVLAEPTAPAGKYFYVWQNADNPCLKNSDESDDYKANVALTGKWSVVGANADKTINLKAVYKDLPSGKIPVTFVQTGQRVQELEIVQNKKITKEQWETIVPVTPEGYEPGEWNFDYANIEITRKIEINLKTPNPKTFTITYELGNVAGAKLCDKDGKEITVYTQSVKYGEFVTVCKATDKKGNWLFDGWKIKDSNVFFRNGQRYTDLKDITLVAQWVESDEKNWTGFY